MTVAHILFPLKALSQVFFFFLTGAALCVQRINQQNCLCMIGLQHLNACWGSQSPRRIRTTRTVPGTCHDFWTWTSLTCIFLQLLTTPKCLSGSIRGGRDGRQAWQDRNLHLFFQHLFKSKKTKQKQKQNYGSRSRCGSHADACRTNWPCGTISSAGQLYEVRASVLQVTVSLKLIIVHA